MSDLGIQIAQKIGQLLMAEPFLSKPMLVDRLAGCGFELSKINGVLLVARGPITGRTVGIVDANGSLLVWCQPLRRVVDLTKIQDTKRAVLKCHQVMLDCMAGQTSRVWWHTLGRFARGEISAGIRAQGLSELVGVAHIMQGPEEALFLELMRRHHADACLEVV